ncbi:MAG: discoidin domain-containing protein [Prolixibacteraceae bacterium]|jgi:hypothetical protein|nr:discoidin domain-containing protein [Prolixibacteraceae bacterium]
MFKRKLNKILLVIVGLLVVCGGYAQTTPISEYSGLGFTNVSENGTSVCPSLYGTNDVHSTNTFRVLNDHADAGSGTYFQWVVFGGTIVEDNGNPVNSSDNDANASTIEVDVDVFIPYYYISHDQFSGSTGDYSEIVVEWHDGDLTDAWVAVRQVSEWECTNGEWQVFTNDIYNDPPAFDVFPADEIIAWGQRSSFELTLPTTNPDDGCPDPALLLMTVVVEDSEGTEVFSGDETDGSYNNFDWSTLSADTYTVTWSLTDGAKSAIPQSHTVTIEPELQIENVAWTTDYCDGGNASAFVSQITDYAFTGDLTYSFDGGSNWQSSAFTSSLSGDGTVYTVQAKLEYTDGHEEFSTEYSFTLPDMAGIAIDAILDPDTDPTDITLVPTDCGNTDDGQISMNPDAMVAQNTALQFDGAGDYLLLNKRYEGEISAFTVAAWVKTNSNDGAILSFDKDQYFQFEVSGGQLQLAATSTDNQNNTVLNDDYSYELADGDWHLVVATFGDNGTNVVYDLYQDGVPVKTSVLHNGSNSIGKTGSENYRYGAIGAVLKSNTFTNAGQAYFFSGSIAEVGIWDSRLTPAQVLEMKRNGMINTPVAPTDHFALNSLPSDVSATDPDVFSDVGNTQQTGTFARFYNASGLENDAPKLYSWDDDVTQVSTERSGLSSGAPGYTFNVSDIFGCGTVDNSADPYVIPNGDEGEPYLLWNVAIEKTATQSTIAGGDVCGTPMAEGMAVDGDLDGTCSYTETETEPANEPWWQVNLGNSYPVNRVRIHAHQAITDFDVFVAPSDFPAGDLANDWTLPGVVVETYIGTINAGASDVVTFPANTNGSYVRIRLHNTGEVLSLNEVEVFTRYPDTDTRKLYLADECTYTIDAFDATINPVPVDGCGQIPTVDYTYSDPQTSITEAGSSLIDEVWNMDYYTVDWTATDENGNDGYLTMTYDVVDEELPVFNINPFDGIPTDITWCDAQSFTLPVPDVYDNQLSCNDLQSISLLRNSTTIYTVPNIGDYPTGTPDETPVLSANMLTGTYDYTWRVVDFSGNIATETITITTQQQPILTEVKYSPITCHDDNNGRVYFSQIDVEPSKPIIYILKSTTSPFTEYTYTDNVFTVSTGAVSETDLGIVPADDTYQAWLEVDGCRTPTAYPEDIVISNPEDINTVNDITHVLCFGDSDGAIDIDPQGGNGSYALHLIGEDDPDTYASAPSYASIQLTEQGMIEAWVFIDTIANGGVNWNAGIFGIPNAGNGYGFRIADGDLQFYVGGQTLNVGSAVQRTWIYMRGEWNGSDVDNTPYLTFETSIGSNSDNTLPAFTATSSGDVYIGSLNDGDNSHNLRGFVRFARIWNSSTIDAQTIAQNQYLTRPIDPDDNLVANYPMSTGTTTSTISNTVNTSQAGTVTGDYLRQPYAYYWVDPDGAYLTNEQDISGYSAGMYNVTLYDPFGCVRDFDIEIETRDEIAPVLNFYTDNPPSNPLPMGDPIIRYTSSADGGNIADNCVYVPYNEEFNPIITDGTCEPDQVVVTYDYVDPYPAGSDLFVDPDGEAGNDPSDLDTRELTGITQLLWTADDGANTSTKEVTYYIVDDTPPTDPGLSDVYLSMPDDACEYVVADNSLDPDLTTFDNCGTGILTNDQNGTATLQSHTFGVGTHTVTWTYTDREFPGVTRNEENTEDIPYSVEFTQTIIVEDNTSPELTCVGNLGDVYLDDNGLATINANDLIAGIDDNCSGSTPEFVVTKNIANGMGGFVSQSSDATTECETGSGNYGDAANAVDNNTDPDFAGCSVALTDSEANPWWQIDFGATHSFYGIQLWAGNTEPLDNFWIVISDDDISTNPPDFSGAEPVWNNNPVYTELVTTQVSGDELFLLDQEYQGQYVSIVKNETAALCLAEVEVYGTETPASSIEMNCVDVRYTPGITPNIDGFSDITLLLTALDIGGNVTSCNSDLRLIDITPPVVVPTQLLSFPVSASTGLIDLNDYVDQINSVATFDACDLDLSSMRVSPANFDCNTIGSQSVTLFISDIHGNEGMQSVVVGISDETDPVIRHMPAPIYLYLDRDGNCTVDPLTDIEGSSKYPLFDDDTYRSSDNCGIATRVVSPATVDCDDIRYTGDPRPTLQLSYTVTDVNGRSTVETFDAIVRDTIAPTATYNDYTCIVNEANQGVINFSDIIPQANLRDNCSPYADIKRYISYDNVEWCDAGNEGTESEPAFTNVSSNVSKLYGSDSYLTYDINNVNDIDLSTAYITDDNTGLRSVTYGFSQEYEFNAASVSWHEENEYSTQRVFASSYNTGLRNTSTAYSTFTNVHLDDEASGPYITDENRNDETDYRWATCMSYDFGATAVPVTDMVIDWTGNMDLTGDGDANDDNDCKMPDYYRVLYRAANGSWYYFTGWTVVSSSSTTVAINTDVRAFVVLLYRGSRGRIGVNEWTVNRQIATEISNVPNYARIQYYAYPGGWTYVGGTIGSLTAAAAGEYNDQTYNLVQSDSIRIEFNHTTQTRRIGIQEFQVRGRKPWDGTTNTACKFFTCDDVGTPVHVWLKWEDKSHNWRYYDTDIDIESYFSITDVKITDCGVAGEYYSFKTENTSSFQTYDYLWETDWHPAPVDGDASKPFYYSGTAYYTTDEVNPSTNKYRPATGMNEGNYGIILTIEDLNDCPATFNYEFDWNWDDGGLATSIIQRDVCFGEESQFIANIPESFTENYYYWDYDLADVSYVSGGEVANNKLTLRFDKATAYTEVFYENVVQDGNQGTDYCREEFTYEVTIHNVQEPILQDDPENICPFTELTYTLHTSQAALFDHLDWVISDAGTVIDGGNFSDDYVTVYWNDLTEVPSIKIRGYNTLGCVDSTTYTFAFEDTEDPVLSFPVGRSDTTHVVAPSACFYVFQSIPIPDMTDNCGIESYNIVGSTETNAAGKYDVGVHEIQWEAYDYLGNTSLPITYTITVQDNEAPQFNNIPLPLILETSATGCTATYSGTGRDVTARDNCDVDADYVTFTLDTIHGTGTVWQNVSTATPHSIDGLEFSEGITRVRYTIADTAFVLNPNAVKPNSSSVEFLVTVRDRTKPQILSGIDDIGPVSTDPGSDEATIAIVAPSGADLWDNCSSSENLTVTSTRDDGRELDDTYPVGTTTITWIIKDEASPANSNSYTQTVTVEDNEDPTFTDTDGTGDFEDASITWCQHESYRIPIPRSYDDNVRVDELTYRVENVNNPGVAVLGGSLLYDDTPNFTVGGVAGLAAHNFTDADVLDGSDYTITWQAIDEAGNTSETREYNLRIEMQPRFNHATTEPIDCGGDQARITVDVSPGATIAESMDLSADHFIRYEGYPKYPGDDGAPEFNIGTGWQESPVFDFNVSGDNEYTVRMRVNGCEAPEQITVNIVAPEAVILDTEVEQHASCPEVTDAAVSASMSGGVPGQPHFTASTQNLTVADYNEIDLTTEGAVEAWVYLDTEGSATIVNKGTAYGLSVNYDAGNEVHHFAVFVDGDELESTYPVTTNRWYHVSGWWDASNLSIRVDEQTTDTQAGTYSATSNIDPLTIGGNNFLGIIREVRLWDLTVAGNAFANGAIPSTKFRGDETGLVGLWDMSEGQGDAANKRVGFGNDAEPSSTFIWEDNLPLPGFYTWERLAPEGENYQAYPLPSDSSNLYLRGLEVGSYRISFTDHYGCAATNTSFKKLIAVDNELPEYVYPSSTAEWTGVKEATIYTDEDVCTATLTTQGIADTYTPDITDAATGGCDFETNWRVVYTPTNELLFNQDYPSLIIDQALVTAELKNQDGDGTNVVRIMVSQNGLDNFDAPEEYIINVVDDQDPVPVGKFNETINLDLDNTPDGGGQVTLKAKNFDNGSTDNCTKDPDLLNPRLAAPSPDQITNNEFDPDDPTDVLWLEEVSFGCGEVGNTVTLYYMVTDETGNSDWTTEASEIVVTDPHAPVFQTTSSVVDGECATVNADNDNNVPAYTLYGDDYSSNDISLDPADYTDNCDVVHARFKLKYLWDGDMSSGNLGYTNNDYDTFGYPAFDADDPATWEINLDPTVDSNGDFIEYYDGTTEVYFELTDKSGNPTEQLVYTVIVLPKPTPGGIE